MRLMMFCEQNRAVVSQPGNFRANGSSHIELFTEPSRKHAGKSGEAAGSGGKIRFEHSREFGDRFVVKDDRIQILCLESGITKTELDCINWKGLVVLFAGEPLLLRCRNYLTIRNKRRC